MKTLFADTFYFIALLSPADQAHAQAVSYTRQFKGALVTTAWVLTEVADGLANAKARQQFLRFYDRLCGRPDVTIVECSPHFFDEGIKLYRTRSDKSWSLTDCISFVVMQEAGITHALTGDHHFEQAGFVAVLN